MKTTQLTLKNGKMYTGLTNGKIYNGKVYLNRPKGGFIKVTEKTGETFESQRKEIIIEKSDIQTVKFL